MFDFDKNSVDINSSALISIERFICECQTNNPSFAHVLHSLLEYNIELYFFGGMIRDLLITNKNPRDIDIVIPYDIEEQCILHILKPYIIARTKFGGYTLNCNGLRVDVWSLSDTWAFRNDLISPPILENLPKTTFLNVEAVVIVYTRIGVTGIYDYGFFDAIRTRIIDINLIINPDLLMCIIRIFDSVIRLRFNMSPDVKRFLEKEIIKFSYKSVIHRYRMHYGYNLVEIESFKHILNLIKPKREYYVSQSRKRKLCIR